MKLNLKNKFLRLFLVFTLCITATKAFAVENQICGIGVVLIKDQMSTFNNKTFVAYTAPNSPASVLPIGTEIIKINKAATKNLSIQLISDLIKGEQNTKVTLYVKYPNKKKEQVVLKRAIVKFPESFFDDDNFLKYWSQVAPAEYLNMDKIPDKVLEQLSSPYYTACKYWKDRKVAFKTAYNICKSYPKNEQNLAFENLVTREQLKTASDRQADMQANILQQQQIQNYTNTMNQININNALRQQNYQIQNINNSIRRW